MLDGLNCVGFRVTGAAAHDAESLAALQQWVQSSNGPWFLSRVRQQGATSSQDASGRRGARGGFACHMEMKDTTIATLSLLVVLSAFI